MSVKTMRITSKVVESCLSQSEVIKQAAAVVLACFFGLGGLAPAQGQQIYISTPSDEENGSEQRIPVSRDAVPEGTYDITLALELAGHSYPAVLADYPLQMGRSESSVNNLDSNELQGTWRQRGGEWYWLPMPLERSAPLQFDLSTKEASADEQGAKPSLAYFDALWVDYRQRVSDGQCELSSYLEFEARSPNGGEASRLALSSSRNLALAPKQTFDVTQAQWREKDTRYLIARELGWRHDPIWRYAQDGRNVVMQRRFHEDLLDVEAIDITLQGGTELQGINLQVGFRDSPSADQAVEWDAIPKDVTEEGGEVVVRLHIGQLRRQAFTSRDELYLEEMVFFLPGTVSDFLNSSPIQDVRLLGVNGDQREANRNTIQVNSEVEERSTQGHKRLVIPLNALPDDEEVKFQHGFLHLLPPANNEPCGIKLQSARFIALGDDKRPATLDIGEDWIRQRGGPFLGVSDLMQAEWPRISAHLNMAMLQQTPSKFSQSVQSNVLKVEARGQAMAALPYDEEADQGELTAWFRAETDELLVTLQGIKKEPYWRQLNIKFHSFGLVMDLTSSNGGWLQQTRAGQELQVSLPPDSVPVFHLRPFIRPEMKGAGRQGVFHILHVAESRLAPVSQTIELQPKGALLLRNKGALEETGTSVQKGSAPRVGRVAPVLPFPNHGFTVEAERDISDWHVLPEEGLTLQAEGDWIELQWDGPFFITQETRLYLAGARDDNLLSALAVTLQCTDGSRRVLPARLNSALVLMEPGSSACREVEKLRVRLNPENSASPFSLTLSEISIFQPLALSIAQALQEPLPQRREWPLQPQAIEPGVFSDAWEQDGWVRAIQWHYEQGSTQTGQRVTDEGLDEIRSVVSWRTPLHGSLGSIRSLHLEYRFPDLEALGETCRARLQVRHESASHWTDVCIEGQEGIIALPASLLLPGTGDGETAALRRLEGAPNTVEWRLLAKDTGPHALLSSWRIRATQDGRPLAAIAHAIGQRVDERLQELGSENHNPELNGEWLMRNLSKALGTDDFALHDELLTLPSVHWNGGHFLEVVEEAFAPLGYLGPVTVSGDDELWQAVQRPVSSHQTSLRATVAQRLLSLEAALAASVLLLGLLAAWAFYRWVLPQLAAAFHKTSALTVATSKGLADRSLGTLRRIGEDDLLSYCVFNRILAVLVAIPGLWFAGREAATGRGMLTLSGVAFIGLVLLWHGARYQWLVGRLQPPKALITWLFGANGRMPAILWCPLVVGGGFVIWAAGIVSTGKTLGGLPLEMAVLEWTIFYPWFRRRSLRAALWLITLVAAGLAGYQVITVLLTLVFWLDLEQPVTRWSDKPGDFRRLTLQNIRNQHWYLIGAIFFFTIASLLKLAGLATLGNHLAITGYAMLGVRILLAVVVRLGGGAVDAEKWYRSLGQRNSAP